MDVEEIKSKRDTHAHVRLLLPPKWTPLDNPLCFLDTTITGIMLDQIYREARSVSLNAVQGHMYLQFFRLTQSPPLGMGNRGSVFGVIPKPKFAFLG